MIFLLGYSPGPWWLLCLGSFFLGLVVGWAIWSRYKTKGREYLLKIEGFSNHVKDLERDLDDCRRSGVEAKGRLAELEHKLEHLEGIPSPDELQDMPSSSEEKMLLYEPSHPAKIPTSPSETNIYADLSENNLQIIEGIGPKLESVLKENGVSDWQALANQTHDDLNSILLSYGRKYQMIDPSSWAKQAALAKDRRWDELIRMQKGLATDRPDAKGIRDSKLEKIMVKLGLLKKYQQDDLKAIEGIGVKIAALLQEAGITTWQYLAQTPVDQLQEILDAAGPRYKLADPGTWPRQAELAASGRWKELQKYQQDLTGGK